MTKISRKNSWHFVSSLACTWPGKYAMVQHRMPLLMTLHFMVQIAHITTHQRGSIENNATGGFHSQRASNAEGFPCHDVMMPWVGDAWCSLRIQAALFLPMSYNIVCNTMGGVPWPEYITTANNNLIFAEVKYYSAGHKSVIYLSNVLSFSSRHCMLSFKCYLH